MVRREIRSFVQEGLSTPLALEVPFSLASLIGEGKIAKSDISGDVVFSTSVFADSVALSIKHICVKLGRLSAPCEVLLNGNSIGRADGEHLFYIFGVAGLLNEGENKLSVVFSASAEPSHIGIFEPVEIVRFNNAIINKVSLTQKHDGDSVTVGIRLDMIGSTENVRAVATLTSSAGQIYYAGLTKGKGSINIRDPLYWWPHGYGVQNLYKLTINLYGDTDI